MTTDEVAQAIQDWQAGIIGKDQLEQRLETCSYHQLLALLVALKMTQMNAYTFWCRGERDVPWCSASWRGRDGERI